MTADELAEAVERAGGVLIIDGENLRCWLPADAVHLAGALRDRKPELIALLHRRGGCVAAFPHCPRCASYALYRENNVGVYECLTCGLLGIEESIARRLA